MKKLVFVGDNEPLTGRQKCILEMANMLMKNDAPHIIALEFGTYKCNITSIDCNQYDVMTAVGHLLIEAFNRTVITNLGRYRNMKIDEDGHGIQPHLMEFDSDENN